MDLEHARWDQWLVLCTGAALLVVAVAWLVSVVRATWRRRG